MREVDRIALMIFAKSSDVMFVRVSLAMEMRSLMGCPKVWSFARLLRFSSQFPRFSHRARNFVYIRRIVVISVGRVLLLG